jgi:hypothetical protein
LRALASRQIAASHGSIRHCCAIPEAQMSIDGVLVTFMLIGFIVYLLRRA